MSFFRLFMAAIVVMQVVSLAGADRGDAPPIVLANEEIELRLDGNSGAIEQVTILSSGLELVEAPGLSPPFRIGVAEGLVLADGDVTALRDDEFDGTAYELSWSTADPALVAEARIELPTGTGPARFTCSVIASGGPVVVWLEYPVIAGIGSLGPDPGQSELIHPRATGYRIIDPLQHLDADQRFGFYPDGYGGAPLQMLAYLERDSGGFHLQVEDATGEAKELNLLRDGNTGWLELNVRRDSTHLLTGTGLDPNGPVLLASNQSGTWEESADRYRRWALKQLWAARGPIRDLPPDQHAGWLFDQIGVATFGISMRRDQRAWFSGLKDLLAVPLLHISGYWWPGGMPGNEWYGGYNDWSLDRIDPANLAEIAAMGDRSALFLFPQHFATGATEYDEAAPDPGSDPVAPWAPYAMEPDPEEDAWSYICAGTTEWQQFYGWRAVELLTRHQADAEYLDIGPGLGRVHCEDPNHDHPPGYGTAIVEGSFAMLDSRRDELHALKGAYLPRGTEMISELYLDRFDYYQARAGGGPLGMLEGWFFRQAEIAGWAEKIPLFSYVYHDYAPVRLDGNLKLADELGELFYWVAARVVLWGGIPELNYELSALERLPGMSGPTWFETYRPTYDCMDLSPYSAGPEKAAFLTELSDLRTRRAREFLAYGRMRRAPALAGAISQVNLDWHLYNTFQRGFWCTSGVEQGPEYHSHGSSDRPSALTSAWSAPVAEPPGGVVRQPREQVGLTLAEIGGSARNVPLILDPPRQSVPLLNFRATLSRRGGESDLGIMQAGATRTIELGPHEAVLVRLAPAECAGESCRYRVYRAAHPSNLQDIDNLLADVTGHAFEDDSAGDSLTCFYLIDDGGGYPTDSLRVTRTDEIHLTW